MRLATATGDKSKPDVSEDRTGERDEGGGGGRGVGDGGGGGSGDGDGGDGGTSKTTIFLDGGKSRGFAPHFEEKPRVEFGEDESFRILCRLTGT